MPHHKRNVKRKHHKRSVSRKGGHHKCDVDKQSDKHDANRKAGHHKRDADRQTELLEICRGLSERPIAISAVYVEYLRQTMHDCRHHDCANPMFFRLAVLEDFTLDVDFCVGWLASTSRLTATDILSAMARAPLFVKQILTFALQDTLQGKTLAALAYKDVCSIWPREHHA